MGIEFGPMSFDDLGGLVQRGNLHAGDPVRRAEDSVWVKVADIPGLAVFAPRASTIAASAPQTSAPNVANASVPKPSRPLAAPVDAEGEPTDLSLSVALSDYNFAILIGPGGVALCDLRDCQTPVIEGARVVGFRPPDDSSPIRIGPLELDITVREVGEPAGTTIGSNETVPLKASTGESAAVPAQISGPPTAEAPTPEQEVRQADLPPTTPVPPPKRPLRRGAKADTQDIAAETLRRMFMPQPTKRR